MDSSFKRLAVVLLLAAVTLFFAGGESKADEKDFAALSKLVLSDSLVYLEMHNIPKIVDDMFKLGLWQDGPAARKMIWGIINQSIIKNIADGLKLPPGFLEQQLANIHTLRLVLVDLDEQDISRPPRLLVQVVLNDSALFDELINQPAIKNNFQEILNEKGARILTPSPKEGKARPGIFIGYKGNVVYIATKRPCLDHLLGLKKFIGRPLSLNPDFKTITKKFRGAGFWGYVNGARLASIIDIQLRKTGSPEVQANINKFVNLKSFGPVSFANWFDRGLGESYFSLDFKEVSPMYEKFRQPPTEMKLLRFFPADTFAGVVLSTKRAPESWDNFRRMVLELGGVQAKENMEKGLLQFEKAVGFRIEDIAVAIKGEVGFVLADFPIELIQNREEPLPRAEKDGPPARRVHRNRFNTAAFLGKSALLVRPETPEKAEKIVESAYNLILGKMTVDGVTPKIFKERHRGISISRLPIQGEIQLCSGWVKDILIISFSFEQIKKIIDTQKDRTDIISAGKPFGLDDMPKKASLIMVFRPAKLFAVPGLLPGAIGNIFNKDMVIFLGANMEKERLEIYSNTPVSGGIPFIMGALFFSMGNDSSGMSVQEEKTIRAPIPPRK